MPRRAYRPLRGVRVLSFELAYSLPAATRMLSELGAEVVKVAPPAGVGFADFTTAVDGVSLGKPSIAINLKHGEGRQLARALVAQADVVCSNFTAPVMPAFGLGVDDLRAIKPELIILRVSGYGAPGPWTNYPAFAAATEAVAGLNSIQGEDDDPPTRVGSGIFADQLAGTYAGLAVVAALAQRQRTGKGRSIDLAMAEGVTHVIGPLVVDTALSGQLPRRVGNRDLVHAPQGVYPCHGDDEWIAISVRDDREWSALAALTADTFLQAPELALAATRLACHAEIDTHLATWTCQFPKADLAERLQASGIAAGPVNKVSDFASDPHLAARDVFQAVRHPHPLLGVSAHPHPAMPWLAAGRRRGMSSDLRPAGADNYRVLSKWLGLDRRAVSRLTRAGALTHRGPFRIDTIPDFPGQPRDPDFARRLGLRP